MFKKLRTLVMKEADVTAVLQAVNKHNNHEIESVGNCGWAEQPDMWFVHFEATEKKYKKIVCDLKQIGEFGVGVSPKGVIEIKFEKAQ